MTDYDPESFAEVVAPEGKLIRECGSLYGTFASESASGVCLMCLFSYTVLVLSSRGFLKNPALSVFNVVAMFLADFIKDVWRTFWKWPDMQEIRLEERFGWCRKMNMAICSWSIFQGIISMLRWMHIGNVNGIRYLGYAVTCPIKQAELFILIAPIIPCYKIVTPLCALITWSMLISGYVAAMYPGKVWYGDLIEFTQTWDVDQLQATQKAVAVAPAFCGFAWIMFIEIPMLCVLYYTRVGKHNEHDMPKGYINLIVLLVITWAGFPTWWMISSEGQGLITDTKLNGWMFVTLNVLSKGGFTMTMMGANKASRPRKSTVGAFHSAVAPFWIMKLQEYDSGEKRMAPPLEPFDEEDEQGGFMQVKSGFKKTNSQWKSNRGGGNNRSNGSKRSENSSGRSQPDDAWDTLDEGYKQFLQDSGVDPSSFNWAQTLDRVNARSHFVASDYPSSDAIVPGKKVQN